MNKRPFLMALATFGAIFLVFFLIILAVGSLTGRSASFPLGDRVGVVPITGVILSSEKINESIVKFRDDPSIKAVVLRIDSPGGGVGPSQEIFEEVRRTAEIKPVVSSMGSVAASGGYYVAAPSTRIVANPGTITGSIGVIMEFTNFQELLGKIGLKTQVIKSGEHKDIGSPVRPMTEEDTQILQALIDDVHDQFVAAVAQGRSLEYAEILALADGRIFSGRQALSLGLVDEMGNLRDAIQLAAELAGIKGDPRTVYPAAEKPKLFDYLIQESAARLRQSLQGQNADGLQYLWQGN
ncbi:signal peptide peptidase A. Serine peptidase. MEROPS family S49 [Geoalkalibacter ferrihydriticus]|uniref:Multidrug transporter n=2 Tax=Geoalkalibacter ferrihydriticus TaxID=392333 RepID=A0A0C2DT71_9BACT|nr:signal peptide peptidase SppA [Geoalkalibacter ferrihydriticus]KIH76624.1 multidrug transporter [Geoalkalibacter ferrihydriticus DSM 17813]SDM04026.1 signal peptide peptidase A. Serine peptidase. MEROPS family S49 [Geoalkalibacter ferrihydriticus]